jgi:hypothetical protein
MLAGLVRLVTSDGSSLANASFVGANIVKDAASSPNKFAIPAAVKRLAKVERLGVARASSKMDVVT